MTERQVYTEDEQLTADDTILPSSPNSMRLLLMGVLNRLKSITGETSWQTSPQRALNETAASIDVFVGEIKPYAGSTSPNANWMICDGRLVGRTNYAALFNIIGTTYGAGDGSTNFQIPDLRGRTAVGAGLGTGLTDRVLGGSHGAEDHVLSTAQLPSHTHANGLTGDSDINLSHNHQISGNGSSNTTLGGTAPRIVALTNGAAGNDVKVTTTDNINAIHSHNIPNTNSTGSGGSHPNVQPSLNLSYLIKVQ